MLPASCCFVGASACAASVVESSSGFPIHVRDEEGPAAVRERSSLLVQQEQFQSVLPPLVVNAERFLQHAQ